jgi:hypothetical protein
MSFDPIAWTPWQASGGHPHRRPHQPPLMFDPYHHHQVEQAVLATASQPAHLPTIEAGTQIYRVTEAEELRFQHCVDCGADQHIHSGEERSQARITNSGEARDPIDQIGGERITLEIDRNNQTALLPATSSDRRPHKASSIRTGIP